jgi:hypothetical protein
MPPGNWSEFSEIVNLSGLYAGLYKEVDKHFSSTFLPMLVADGLAVILPLELANNRSILELNDDCFVIHVGSVKLALYKGLGRNGGDLFSVQLFSNQDRDTIGMTFYTTQGGLEVEYTSMTPTRGPDRFMMKLPGTSNHPLNTLLSKLYPLVCREYAKIING